MGARMGGIPATLFRGGRQLGQDPWVGQLAERWHIDRVLHAAECT